MRLSRNEKDENKNVSFPMSQFFKSGGQIIGASTSASVLPVDIQD